jgi:putative hydrolase of the HAD superfamily
LTLIKSNPLFKRKRAEFLTENFNPKGLSVDEVMTIIHNIDKACDRLNEMSGKKKKAVLMYKAILKRLRYNCNKTDLTFLNDIVNKINRIFFEFPPVLLNNNILPILNFLKSQGYTLNISSNTGFIEGSFLRDFLIQNKMDTFLDFSIFSDEIDASKPSADFYNIVYRNANAEKHQILHIGDNYRADFLGATNFGFNALLIENKDYGLELIKQTLDEKNRLF